jgi:hypothetical protein
MASSKIRTPLLKNAFGAGTQKGPRKRKDFGEDGEGNADTQHGELANSEDTKKVKKTKGASGAQKQAPIVPPGDSGAGDYDLSRNGANGSTSPAFPKQMKHEMGKVLPQGDFNLSKNGAKMEAPADKVMVSAHRAKMRATENWMDGHIDSKKHDDIHRRANMVLRAARRGR